MANILFIAPYPIDGAPSQRFRFEQYVGILENSGHSVKVVPFLSEKDWKKLYTEGNLTGKAIAMIRSILKRWGLLFSIGKYDKIFIHREAAMIGPPFFEWFIAKILRRKFIYDFDDAIWLPNYSQSNAGFQKLKMYKKVNKIIRWAETITVGNDFLAEYARQFNSNIRVIPTTIDLDNVHSLCGNPHQEPVVIGWTGTHTTGQYLNDLIPVLDELSKKHRFIFRVISNQHPNIDRAYLEFVPWKKESEIEDLATFNIGVMPLTDSEWSRGKCGFKGLQYMALQIPAVMSPVGVNNQIISNGVNGFLCSSQQDWLDALERLVVDPELRQQIGIKGKETVQLKYSVEANRNNYLQLFES